MDDNFGPLLNFENEDPSDSRRMRFGSPSIRKDANSSNGVQDSTRLIQETRQEKRPARMVGLSGLDSASEDMDVRVSNRTLILRSRKPGVDA